MVIKTADWQTGRIWASWIALAVMFGSCGSHRPLPVSAPERLQLEIARSAVFSTAFTGFTLMDPETGQTLADFQGDKYFTPASNTKILTLGACLEMLKDTVPGIQLMHRSDDVYFRGTGDPTFLHPAFRSWQRCRDSLLAARSGQLIYVDRPFPMERFGPGWAWDDYGFYYQPEHSVMPVYGNCIAFSQSIERGVQIQPPWFERNFIDVPQTPAGNPKRREFENIWTYRPNQNIDTCYLPFLTGSFLRLLEDTLQSTIAVAAAEWPDSLFHTVYGTPLDTVLRLMMYDSDNFLADQMLIVCAGEKFGVLRQDTVIRWMLEQRWYDLPQKPRWVDGSGLSRYNLISPRDLAQVLLRLWKTQPHERLLSLFPAGGVRGTIADHYAGPDGKPYIFAKSGGMSGVHCLSGYLRCKSGKILIFSFMHNNFLGSNKSWKNEMQRMFEMIREW